MSCLVWARYRAIMNCCCTGMHRKIGIAIWPKRQSVPRSRLDGDRHSLVVDEHTTRGKMSSK